MKIAYDPKVDALSMIFGGTSVTTKRLAEGIAADYDAQGRLADIEILDALKRFGDAETLRHVVLEGVGSAALGKQAMSKFVNCIDNHSNPASLILGKVYRTLPDAEAEAHKTCSASSMRTRQSLTTISTRRPSLHRSSCRKGQGGR